MGGVTTYERIEKGFLRAAALTAPLVIDATAIDAGNTGQTHILRSGLVLGKLTSGGNLKQYTDGLSDGTEVAYAILLQQVDLKDGNPSASATAHPAEVLLIASPSRRSHTGAGRTPGWPRGGISHGRQHLLRAVLRDLLHAHRALVDGRREAPALVARPGHAPAGRLGLPLVPAAGAHGVVRSDRRQPRARRSGGSASSSSPRSAVPRPSRCCAAPGRPRARAPSPGTGGLRPWSTRWWP